MAPFAVTGLLIASLASSLAASFVVHRLTDGERRGWLLPAAFCGQAGLAAWSFAVVPAAWLPASLLLAWVLLVLAVIDQIALRLPDGLTLPLMGAGLLVAAETADPLAHGVGLLAGYGAFSAMAAAYRAWRGHDGIGQGDAKLMAAAGAWLGWQALPSVVMLGSSLALSVIAMRWLRRVHPSADGRVPFGPSLCLAIWMVWLYGPLTMG